MNKKKSIHDYVYNYPTKNKQGFIQSEIDDILKSYPDINMDKFNNALCGITCMVEEETGNIIIYHCDIELAIRCGTQNRNPTAFEYD